MDDYNIEIPVMDSFLILIFILLSLGPLYLNLNVKTLYKGKIKEIYFIYLLLMLLSTMFFTLESYFPYSLNTYSDAYAIIL